MMKSKEEIHKMIMDVCRETALGVFEWIKSDNCIVTDITTGDKVENAELNIIDNPESIMENYVYPRLREYGILITPNTDENGK